MVKPTVGPDRVLMPIQSGRGNAERLAYFRGPEPMIGVMPGVPSHLKAAGVIHQVSVGNLLLGWLQSAEPTYSSVVGLAELAR